MPTSDNPPPAPTAPAEPAEPAEPAAPTAPTAPRSKTSEDWELIRRSIAMLPPGSWAMRREQALESLSALIAGLREARHAPPK